MKRFITISLALLLLMSNLGVAMNTHFCGGEAVKTSFSIGVHHLDCGMKEMVNDCDMDLAQENQFQKKPCCENQHRLLLLDENAELHAYAFPMNPIFWVALVHVLVYPSAFAEQYYHPKGYHFALAPDRDFHVLYQTFLI